MNYAGKTYGEFSKNLATIYNSTKDKAVQDAMDAYDKNHEDSVKGQWERYNNILRESSIDEETIQQLSFNSAKNIQSLITSVSSASRE
jgi:glutamyl-tRNA reductase